MEDSESKIKIISGVQCVSSSDTIDLTGYKSICIVSEDCANDSTLKVIIAYGKWLCTEGEFNCYEGTEESLVNISE